MSEQKIKLSSPITVGEVTITEITPKILLVKDLKKIYKIAERKKEEEGEPPTQFDIGVLIISATSGLKEDFIEGLTLVQFEELGEILTPFFASGNAFQRSQKIVNVLPNKRELNWALFFLSNKTHTGLNFWLNLDFREFLEYLTEAKEFYKESDNG